MGRVLKSPSAHRIEASLVDAKTRALAVLAEAKRQRDAVLADAARDAETICERATADAALRLNELARRFETELEATSAARQAELVDLAVGVAEKLVVGALERDPTHVRSLVRDAVAKLPRASSFEVRVHPDDREAVAEAFTAFDVQGDPRLARGDAVVNSAVGRVDARLVVRLAAIREALGSDRRG